MRVCVWTRHFEVYEEHVTRVVAFQFWLHFCCTQSDLAVSINCTIVVNRTIDGNGGIEENDGGDETNRNVREEISWV